MRMLTLVTLTLLAYGCVPKPKYVYKQALPSGDPRVKISTMGITGIKLDEGFKTWPVRALHVRIVVHNDSKDVWTMEAWRQKALISGTVHAEPTVATVDGKQMELAVFEPGDTRTFDLYYELPPKVDTAAEIPDFHVDWRIDTPGRMIASSDTSFTRYDVVKPPRPPKPRPKPVDPHQTAKQLQPKPSEDGMPEPGRAESTGYPSYRD
jgi:hypothetical protein